MMEWYNLFKSIILDRGADYYQSGCVTISNFDGNCMNAVVRGTKDYHVDIVLNGENVICMTCDCPYAEDGNNCKHMAAVLFQFEENLSDEENLAEQVSGMDNITLSLQGRIENEREKAVELVNKIPEAKIRELLVSYIMSDASLKNRLELEYSSQIDMRQMSALKNEINDIVRDNSNRGFVDWYHASDFTNGLCYFLDSKVKLLIERNALEQAFELTNIVFHCIGNIDIDDSDGGTSFVADGCYECWKLILQKCDEKQKKTMKKWFESHRRGFVIDFMEEYLEEFLLSEFRTEDMIKETIRQMDKMIEECSGTNESPKIYSVHYGYEDVLLKRLEYMKMLDCSDSEIMEYRKQNRHFFVIREMEIQEAFDKRDYEKAKQILLESRKMDKKYPGQLKKYSEQLIEIYGKMGEAKNRCEELLFYLENFQQRDLNYFNALKKTVKNIEEWENIVDRIAASNKDLYFVCDVLEKEKRCEELMDKVETNGNIHLLDEHVNYLKKALPDRVINMYAGYVLELAKTSADRNRYRELAKYLKKISDCPNGKKTAVRIADGWHLEYKRRPAMMDELRKMGF